MDDTTNIATSGAEPAGDFQPSNAEAPASDLTDTQTMQPEAGAEAPASAPQPQFSAPQAPAGLDPDALAQAFARANAPFYQHLAPRAPEPKHPWQDRKAYWGNLPEGEGFYEALHERQEQFARHVAQQEVRQALEHQRQEFSRVLQGQQAYFAAQFAKDPNFAPIQAHFDKYIQRGYDPADARFLAERDAGVNGTKSAQASPGAPRPMPVPPRHATSPATRTSPTAPPKQQAIKIGPDGEAMREVRFKARASAMGIPWNGIEG